MQRNPNETFADYKERRAAANLAVKRLNADSRGGTRRDLRGHFAEIVQQAIRGGAKKKAAN